jgi:cytochrome P450
MLALRPDVQEKLREELANVRAGDGQLGYDDLNELKYLDAVCRETLRL